MRRIILNTILLCSFITCTNLSAEKEVAITIDDLPIAHHGGYLNSNEEIEYFHRILDILDEYDVKVFGFAVGQYITEYKWELLEEFIVRGHVLGNHTYSHPDLNRVSCMNYIEDIKKCESVIFDLMSDIKYFRYPMLHRGNSSEKRDSIYTFLNESDYVIVPVSIDNDEFLYNKDYIEAIANACR